MQEYLRAKIEMKSKLMICNKEYFSERSVADYIIKKKERYKVEIKCKEEFKQKVVIDILEAKNPTDF